MQKGFSFFPGRIQVVFRKGPQGYLSQDPTNAAKLLKDNPSLQDKSAPLADNIVQQNALTVVHQRGGDASDRTEVLGDYILQFGKYKGKSFRWLLENDVDYTIYLLKHIEKEKAAGVSMTEGNSKASLLSFVDYAHSFDQIKSLLRYESEKPTARAASEDDQLVGFGCRAKGRMMDADEELEKAMLSITPNMELAQFSPSVPTVKRPVALPPELQFLVKELPSHQQTERTGSAPGV
ncbi:uncharacterized protein LOC114458046 [Gouania willdenowi]|uniref:uncharacterized protein LOC114458046 n=1 Tax=Gouania willdenowi TaxID=441366 RepID=UPI001056BF8B|nr:uncharacterized protein LOC114458046 [Gouania willdenowi]